MINAGGPLESLLLILGSHHNAPRYEGAGKSVFGYTFARSCAIWLLTRRQLASRRKAAASLAESLTGTMRTRDLIFDQF